MQERYAQVALRVGLSFAFLYPPLSALFDPNSWIGYFPNFLLDMAAGNELWLLHTFGIVEVIIALWILSGWRIRIPAGIAAFMLVGIVLFNLPSFPVLFRDLSIAAMAVALVFLEGRYTNAHTELLARNQY
ncbi:MAG TPA: DoxX family membrane protein [Candidatus Paceibacterota bacterium]